MADTAPAHGLTPAKLGLIVVLSIVLIAVILMQSSGGRPSAKLAPRARKAAADRATPRAEPVAPHSAPRAGGWPTYPLDDVLAHNPFALPATMLPAREAVPAQTGEAGQTSEVASEVDRENRTRQAKLIDSWRQQGVDMIVKTSQGSVARVGDLTFREGDVVFGLRVMKITTRGIVLAEESALGQE